MVEFSVRFWETEIRSTTIDSLYSRIPPTVGQGFVVSRVLRLSLIFTSHVTSRPQSTTHPMLNPLEFRKLNAPVDLQRASYIISVEAANLAL